MATARWKNNKLVDIVDNRQDAENLAVVLKENCDIAISKMYDGKFGVYWKPRIGIICPLGVV